MRVTTDRYGTFIKGMIAGIILVVLIGEVQEDPRPEPTPLHLHPTHQYQEYVVLGVNADEGIWNYEFTTESDNTIGLYTDYPLGLTIGDTLRAKEF